MSRASIASVVIGVFIFMHSTLASTFDSPETLGTCTKYLSAAPLKLDSLFLLGDSITNASSFKRLKKEGVRDREMNFSGQKTVSGIGIEQAINLLASDIDHSVITDTDILFTNLGVNNWGQAIKNMPSVENLIDKLIADIRAVNSDILILWQEPYAHSPLVSSRNIAVGAALVADYLRTKDAAGEICLIPWSDIAVVDPTTYTTAKSSDGVHIWGNEGIYQKFTFDYIDALRDENI